MNKLKIPSWLSKSNTVTNFYIIGGISAALLWLSLLVAGLHINSSYYRTAITYGFADWSDWMIAICTFTLSNVTLLAFCAGLLGGIISKISVTEGFRRSYEELDADEKVSPATYENPFISAFRGIFIFLAILSVQYFSSFTDLNSIAAVQPAAEKQVQAIDQPEYAELVMKIKDTNTRKEVMEIWKGTLAKNTSVVDSDSLSVFVKKLKDSLKVFRGASTPITRSIETQIHSARLKMKAPANSELAGMSSSAYFKFAIVVSLLSFVCGYDPSRFTSLLNQVSFLSGKSGKGKEPAGGKDT